MPTHSYLAADEELQHLCLKAFESLIRLNETAEAEHQAGKGGPLLHGALLSMTSDMLCLHRSVWCLCNGGWAFATPVLLRTMMDLIISTLAVTHREEDREYMGFKYMYGFQKEGLATLEAPTSVKEEARADIANAIQHLSADDQARAKAFLEAKLETYWYSPEYRKPSDVLAKTGSNPVLKRVYALFSGAAHAGFAGLREFRDQPWIIDSAPRADKVSQNRALFLSARLLLEFAAMRANVEAPAAARLFGRLISELADASTRCRVTPNLADL